MRPLASFINVIAFSALFVAYASVGEVDKPDGVRRALETYERALKTSASSLLKPAWKITKESV